MIIGSNVRFEAPLVNARIRKAWRHHTVDNIIMIGPSNLDLLYDYTWAGDDMTALSSIYTGSHPITALLKTAKKPVIILGQQIQGANSNVYDVTKAIASKYNAEFNLLHANASQVAAFDLGFKPSTEFEFKNNSQPGVMWLFGVDDENIKIPKNCFVIYQVSSLTKLKLN